jgi:hypothetical protein
MENRKPIVALGNYNSKKYRFIGMVRPSMGSAIKKVVTEMLEKLIPKAEPVKPAASKRLTKKLKVRNKLIQDATGEEVDFTELGVNDAVTVGATAEIGGKKATGEYLLPNGVTYVFRDGRLSKITAAPKEEPAFAKKVVTIKPVPKKVVQVVKPEPVKDRTTGVKEWLNSRKIKPNPTATPDNRYAGILDRYKAAKKKREIEEYLKKKNKKR